MTRREYTLITKRRWLWPLIEFADILLAIIAEEVQARIDRKDARRWP